MFNAPICDVGLNQTEHLLSRLRDLDKDTVVDLEQTEELQDFTGLGCDFVDTRAENVDEMYNAIEYWIVTYPRILTTKYNLG